MDSLAIKQLKLCYAFREYNPGVENSVNIKNDSEQWVIDDEKSKSSIFVDRRMNDKCLYISNDDKHEIVLLSIDHVLIKEHKGGIADCAVFDNVSFYFIEFKSNALGRSIPQINKTYEKAIGQLKEAVNLFDDKIEKVKVKFFDVVKVSCDIVVSERFPKHNSTEQALKVSFAKNMKGIPLYFSREIKF